ncbi:MAG TPA: GNAT family N-acetyltransferase [Pseudoxanthomonas sp.]
MTAIELRDARPADFAAVVALNDSEVSHTSAMDEARLRQLHSYACYHKVVEIDGAVGAFLLAMREGCGYVNANFEWFAARYPSFLYVDRIVVGARHQGLRLGKRLYLDLFDYARTQNIPVVACEYNLAPPNEPSRIFHDKFGFQEVGSQWLDGGAKQVSLQVAPV